MDSSSHHFGSLKEIEISVARLIALIAASMDMPQRSGYVPNRITA